jgi:predicted dinucleotide-binding enzyme
VDRIGIAGTGRIAQALGRLLYRLGQPVIAIAGRDPARTRTAAAFINKDVLPLSVSELPAHASRVLIAVPDDALEDVARTLAAAPRLIEIAVHTCGSR